MAGTEIKNLIWMDCLYNPSTTTMTKSFLGMCVYVYSIYLWKIVDNKHNIIIFSIDYLRQY